MLVTINAIIIAPDPGTSNTVSICGSGSVIQLIDSLGGSPDTTGTWTGPDSLPHVGTFDPAIDQQGAYTYHVAGTAPCADAQATVTITITNPNANAGADVAICFGDTTQLSATGGTQYVWTPITSLSDPNIGNPLAYPTSTGTYTVTVTDANGCSGNDAVQVTVHALPIVNAGNDVSICTGQTTPIGGTPTGPAGSTFLWSPAAGLNNTASANPIAQPGSTTNYVVSVTDLNLCNNTDSVLVTVNPLPTINAGNDTTVCTGSGVQLNATGTGTFSWIPSTGLNNASIPNPIASPTATTTYTVTLTDGVSCVNSDDITVTVLGLPSANAGPDLYVCPGFDVQLQGNGGGSFNWSPANTLDNATIANPQASPLSTTVYTLTVTDGNGCSASDIAQVNVSADPPIDAGPDQDICNGQTAVLGGTPTSVPGTTYLWSPSSGLDNATIANPTTSSTTTITYDLAVTSDTCTSHDQVTITLQGVAQGAFVIKLEPTCDEVRAYFTDQSSGGAQWLWDFGDGTTSTEPDPQHYFPYGQPIDVSLVLTDVFGCTDTVTQHIDVATFDNYVHYEMPNVFTPNGDGNNDVFTLNSNAVLGSCATMFIFNRWGQKMFESLAGDLVWDGHNFAGKECTAGTYFFVITVKDITFKGDVYLNR